MESSAELRKDVHELQNLLSMSSRPAVRKWLDEKITLCQNMMEELKKQEMESAASGDSELPTANKSTMTSPSVPLPTLKITNYAWDQSDKYVKLYITLPGVQSARADQITLNCEASSFEMTAHDISGKNHSIVMKGLLFEIDPAGCMFKQKTDSLLIMLKKAKQGQDWKCLTKAEMASKEKNTPKIDEKADPQDSLMNMMKQMYEDGDDEMKRTIRKAWHESQNKKNPMMPADL